MDALDCGLEVVLSQVLKGEERPVLYISWKLYLREAKYSTVEKECLAIKWAILTLRYFLLGWAFTLCSDHAPLQWLYRGLGAVLSQVVEGEERPVLYISWKLYLREAKYSTVEKECLAIKWAILTLRYFLLGWAFTLCSDHAPLQWLYRGLGAVLSQVVEGEERPVLYISWNLREAKYSTVEKEYLAIKWAILTLRYFLLGWAFTLCSDHAPLQWLYRGLGAVLSQVVEGEERPVLYISWKLYLREAKYSTVEKECLAIKRAILTLRYFLLGWAFTLCSDHGPLQWLYHMKDTNAWITRWYLALQPFKFEVVHRPGMQMAVTDFLSRKGWGGER
ncbi:uncharacterized protein LOC127423849 isoform X2 [Myxocyprinus asiaticus]|nr:uncharacterized protein LOC127423849 isoform X2 [Myxocyprinus asiaticus]